MWMTLIIIVISILVFTAIRFCYRTDTKQNYLKDSDGNILIFHGINVNSDGKSDPRLLGTQTKEDYLQLSRRWGFNAVRFLLFWEAIEPEKGHFNSDYLKAVRERLDWCEEAGLSVILDMHQDLYCSGFGGDGAPDWAVKTDGKPFKKQLQWELNYFQPAVKRAIENFWDSSRGNGDLQKHYIASLCKAVEALGDHKSVVGIDLYNEPTMATFSGIMKFEKKFLTPLLQEAIDRIREINKDLWIFFEPSALGPNQGFRTSLGRLKDKRKGEPRLVYFPHIYTLDLDVTGKYIGFPFYINFWANRRKKETRRFNTPLMVGEFGLSEESRGALDYLQSALAMFDRISSGWFYWANDVDNNWGIVKSSGEEYEKTAVLERPYPRKIAGENPSFHWDVKKRIFNLTYKSTSLTDKTEVYIPVRHWPEGWELNSSGIPLQWSFDRKSGVLYLISSITGKVDITIVPNMV